MARFIAEIGSNHNGDLGRALELVDACADAGAGAMKVQLFRIEDLFAPEALAANPELRDREEREFPTSFLEPLAMRCHERGMEFGVTPFSLWAVEVASEHADFLKVASYEVLWHDLLRACSEAGQPLIISTGMATLGEVEAAVAAVDSGRLTLLHCVSAYPVSPDECNLAAIDTLRNRFGCAVGWSDHSGDVGVVERAVRRWGACEIELHVDLPDQSGFEAGHHNWTPERLAQVIQASAGPALSDSAPLDGDGDKRPTAAEVHDVPWRADPSDGLRPLLATREALQVP